jgi:hypothetical protein
VARRDVEEAELVGARRVVGLGGLHGVAGVAQFEELHALHDAPVLHVEAGDEADLQGHHTASRRAALIRASASAGSMRPS